MDVVVAYDIETVDRRGERRLRAVARICEGYGVRRQKSVFECRLSDVQFIRLVEELKSTIDPRVDSVVFYGLGRLFDDARSSIGKAMDHDHSGPWVL